jgi:hypothetical protein
MHRSHISAPCCTARCAACNAHAEAPSFLIQMVYTHQSAQGPTVRASVRLTKHSSTSPSHAFTYYAVLCITFTTSGPYEARQSTPYELIGSRKHERRRTSTLTGSQLRSRSRNRKTGLTLLQQQVPNLSKSSTCALPPCCCRRRALPLAAVAMQAPPCSWRHCRAAA